MTLLSGGNGGDSSFVKWMLSLMAAAIIAGGGFTLTKLVSIGEDVAAIKQSMHDMNRRVQWLEQGPNRFGPR